MTERNFELIPGNKKKTVEIKCESVGCDKCEEQLKENLNSMKSSDSNLALSQCAKCGTIYYLDTKENIWRIYKDQEMDENNSK